MLRIAIATAGRFHVLDLARELDHMGHQVKFYSYVPRHRARRFGLRDENHVGLLYRLWPWLLASHLLPRFAPEAVEVGTWRALNAALAAQLAPCDVLVMMSGIYLEAAEVARRRYGAKIMLVRSSKHVLGQDEILARTPGAQRPSRLSIARELAGYATADMISVPSTHVARSFERDPSAHAKLVVNPLGVDLAQFPLLPRRPLGSSRVFVFAGIWNLRKGCDLLETVIRRNPSWQFLHVGPIGDYRFPDDEPRCRHLPKVDQSALSEVYRQADVLVLPSREDGFGVVLAQALASGLPVVCSDATGGEDLRHSAALAQHIEVVKAECVDALEAGMATMIARLEQTPGMPSLSQADRDTLTWRAFAEREQTNLRALCSQPEGRSS